MSAIFHHTKQIQILKLFTTASLAVISPSLLLWQQFPRHYVAMLKFHMATQFPGPTLTADPHQPQQLAQS